MMEKITASSLCLLLMISGLVPLLMFASENAGAAGLASSPWPCFHGNVMHTGLSPYSTSQVNGTLKWSYATKGAVDSSPTIGGDGTIYVGSRDTNLYALDPAGAREWNFTTVPDIYHYQTAVTSSPAIGSDGTIYFTKNSYEYDDYDHQGVIYALYSSGTLKWSYNAGYTDLTSPAIGSDGTIYFGSDAVYALNPSGTLKWSFIPPGDSNFVTSSPAVGSDGTIYAGLTSYFSSSGDATIIHTTWDYNVYALNPNGTAKWNYTTGSGTTFSYSTGGVGVGAYSSPAIGSDGTIYIGSGDKNVYALDPSGTLKWNFTLGDAVASSPAIGSDGTIYVGSNDGKMNALDPDGTLKWSYITGGKMSSSPAIGSDGTVYFGSDNVYAMNPNGTLKWSYTPGGLVSSSPAIGSDGTVYIGSSDKKLYAFGVKDAPVLCAPQNLSAKPYNGQVVLSWGVPKTDGGFAVSNYKIYRGTTSGGEALIATIGNVQTYTDTSVSNEQTYYYKVSAVNSAGEGVMSTEVSATPAASGPTPPPSSRDDERPWLVPLLTIICIIVAILFVAAFLTLRYGSIKPPWESYDQPEEQPQDEHVRRPPPPPPSD